MKNLRKKKEERTQIISTIIGPGAAIVGDLSSVKNIMINADVTGECYFTDKAFVGSEGHIVGNVTADYLRVEGLISGNITANTVELLDGAIVGGDIITKKLIIDDGASFNGKCTMETEERGLNMNDEIIDLDNETFHPVPAK